MRNYDRDFSGYPALPEQPMSNVGDLICQYTGKVFSQAIVRVYNQYTRDFNNTRYRSTQEFLLDQRHKFIHQLMIDNRQAINA